MADIRLSAAQRQHLGELAALADTGGTGEAHWNPSTPGEWAVARALERRGYLKSNVSGARRYSLTDSGLKEGRHYVPPTRGGRT